MCMTIKKKTICLFLSVSFIALSPTLAMDPPLPEGVDISGARTPPVDPLQEARSLRHEINSRLNSGFEENLKVDVAIIGAGASGLYSAYRLANDKKYENKKVHVFEMSNKIGGRLESVEVPLTDLIAELGGMRYINTQEIVTALIETKLGLENEPFPMGDDSRLIGYYRKQHMKASAWLDSQRGDKPKPHPTHYHLAEDNKFYSADQLFSKVIYDVLMKSLWFQTQEDYKKKVFQAPDNKYNYVIKLNREEWDAIKLNLTYDFEKSPYFNMPLNSLGFWNILKDQVGQEGYNFLADAGAYYSNTLNWNAAEAFPYMIGDFSRSDIAYKTVKGGYDLIAYKLAEGYLNSSNNTNIWSQKKLLNFKHATNENEYRYELTFRDIPTQAKWKVHANQIILAMPRRSLELLNQNNFFFRDSTLQNNIKSVIMEPACKILLGFEKPWWQQEQQEPLSGHSVTDLPMRQCYYFGVDVKNSHAVLLASYNDMQTVPFWSTLAYKPTVEKHKEELKKSIKYTQKEIKFLKFGGKNVEIIENGESVFGLRIKNLKNKISAQKIGSEDKITSYSESLFFNPCLEVMVKELVHQLRELHEGDGDTIPRREVIEPYVAMFKDWSMDPYGGGYHAWQSSYPIKEVVSYMRKPFGKENVFICGEAYSNQQGWVEGAFCIAERMLQDHLGLGWPEWLENRNYYLGW